MSLYRPSIQNKTPAGLSKTRYFAILYYIPISKTQIKRESRTRVLWKKLFKSKRMSLEELSLNIWKLDKLCLTPNKDIHEIHLNRLRGLDIIEDITKRCPSPLISPSDVVHIIWAYMCVIHHILLRQKQVPGVLDFLRRREMQRTLRIYERLLDLLGHKFYRLALDAILTFYREGKVWNVEFLCAELLLRLLEHSGQIEIMLNDTLRTCVKCVKTENVMEARQILQVATLVVRRLGVIQISPTTINNIFRLFVLSINGVRYQDTKFDALKNGLNGCIKNMILHLPNTDLLTLIYIAFDYVEKESNNLELLLILGELLELASKIYMAESYQIISKELFERVMRCSTSENPAVSFLAINVICHLFDTKHNLKKLYSVRIYNDNCQYDIKIGHGKKKTFKQQRHVFYDSFFSTLKTHYNDPLIIHGLYLTVCILILECPVSLVAASGVVFALAIQKVALENKKSMARNHSYHVHAMAASILSLICYVFQAEILYKHVNKVIATRAEYAPHLIPPLKTKYQLTENHVSWNREDLFFEEWELRYGIWKCFKGNNKTD